MAGDITTLGYCRDGRRRWFRSAPKHYDRQGMAGKFIGGYCRVCRSEVESSRYSDCCGRLECRMALGLYPWGGARGGRRLAAFDGCGLDWGRIYRRLPGLALYMKRRAGYFKLLRAYERWKRESGRV